MKWLLIFIYFLCIKINLDRKNNKILKEKKSGKIIEMMGTQSC